MMNLIGTSIIFLMFGCYLIVVGLMFGETAEEGGLKDVSAHVSCGLGIGCIVVVAVWWWPYVFG